jgi:type I restriction-modification system DNA methylase subunit
MINLSDIGTWKQNFGLLPILLNPNNRDNKFLMLNGGNGDFCLQTSKIKEDIDYYYGISWSTNTKNFVILDNKKVIISNWFEKKIEEIPFSKVESNSDKFYKYLISKSYKTESDVVPFILDIFRKLRNITFEKERPTDALNLLFQLLISIEEDSTGIDYQKWGIEKVDLPSQFDYFVELMKKGVKSINPNLDLILRHSAGSLFQEAHREVIYFNPQRDLFGGVSSKLIIKNDAYSSIHYTPQYLARTIVENSLKHLIPFKKSIKIFDPSCGSSEFLIEALKQLKNLGFVGKVKIIGWDTSESAVNTSKFLLQYEKRSQWNNSDLEFEIYLVNDSLTELWENDYDLILMNPPFVSWELLKSKDSKDAVIETLGSSFRNGKPNQASAFFYKATKSLKNDGVIGCVLPSSIFTFDSYSRLRNQIREDFNISILARLGNFVFEDALTDVSFFIGKKEVSFTNPKLIWTKNEKGVVQEVLRDLRKMVNNNEHSVEDKSYSIYTPSNFPLINNSWKTISLNENKLMKDIERYVSAGHLNPISEIFNINQGALLGIKNIFKIDLQTFEDLPKNEHRLFRPVITNNSIKKGELIISEYVWFPYNKNGLIIKQESELENLQFAKDVLIPNKPILEKRKGVNEWWALTRPRNWQFEKDIRLYSNRFGNSNSFAFDSKGNCVIEEGNAFLPKKEFEIEDYYFYLSCFTSKTFETLLSIYSKQIMSGYDLGKVQIKNIPIPNIHSTKVKNSEAYRKLVDLGKELEKGNSFVKQVIDDVLNNYFYPRI